MLRLYRFLLNILSPFLRIYFYIRCLYAKDNFKNVKNHFGIADIQRPSGKLLWIHAASIGESTSALTFINHIKKQFPNLNVLITTITVTSANILYTKISNISNCYHQFAVVDKTSWIEKFLDHWQMDVAVFVESEIWPNSIDILKQRNIPTFLLNARLSNRSFERWSLVKKFISQTLRKFDCILAQSELDAQRYSFFSPFNTKRIDNLKYANAVLHCNDDLLAKFKTICAGRKIFVAASTHEKEEEVIIEAHKKLIQCGHELLTIVIPRHLTRVKRVCEVIKNHDLSFALRSEMEQSSATDESEKKEIYVVDTFGEVGTFFRLADVCFVGGSLISIGGHNIYEPVAFGKPVLHGPFMDNALEVRDFLRSNNVAFEVKSADDMFHTCNRLLVDEALLKNIANVAVKITRNNSLKEIDEIMKLNRFVV